MHNNNEKISASEINKYTFCPYQWYYERLYGAKYLRKKYQERNLSLNLKDENLSNFKRGLKFHNYYRLKRFFILILKIALVFSLAILILLCICYDLWKI